MRRALRLTRRLAVLLGVGLLLLVVGFSLYAWQVNARGSRAIEQVRQQLEGRGLLGLYIDQGDNETTAYVGAAAYWRAAMEAVPEAGDRPLHVVGLVAVNDVEPTQQYHPDTIAALREVFAAYPRFLQLVEDARNAPHGRFYITGELSDPLGQLEILGKTRRVARWLQERSHLAEADTDGEAYVESITAILELSGLLAEERSIIAALVSGSIDALARHAVMDGLSRIELSADQLERLAKAFEDRRSASDPLFYIGHDLSWQYHLAGADVQSYLQYYESRQSLMTRQLMVHEPDWFDGADLPGYTKRLWSGLLLNACPGRYELRFAEHMQESLYAYDELKQLDNDAKRQWAWIRAASDRVERVDRDESSGLRHMHGDNVVIVARSMTRMESMLALAPVALRIERYRMKNGRWPDKLSDVYTQAPLDAYGEAIRYRKNKQGVVVYHVGENGVDENGFHHQLTNDPKQPPDADDWSFMLYNPELRNSIPPPDEAIDPDYDESWNE